MNKKPAAISLAAVLLTVSASCGTAAPPPDGSADAYGAELDRLDGAYRDAADTAAGRTYLSIMEKNLAVFKRL